MAVLDWEQINRNLPLTGQSLTGSIYLTGSLEVTDISSSFSGSFQGDGSNLANIPASAITGLNLNQISSGSVSASISPDRGLEINTSLDVAGNISGSGDLNIEGSVTATSFTGSLLGGNFIKSGSTSDDILLGDGTTTPLSDLLTLIYAGL